ncbi:MAG: serine/threonine-protein kinase [Kofleriaceae bacterium]|nr:serine/threonine-protein kinase [Kofleriaceae bacterium]
MSCPTQQVLLGMVEQTLDLSQAHDVETHVATCTACQGVMHSLATGPTAVGTPPPGSEPEAQPLGESVSLGERYEVKRLLGRGGMGAVYLARDLTLGRDVAVKLHGAGSGGDRLHREAIAMAKLAHPNVVTVYEVASHDDRLYVAMEYVRGGTLRTWLTEQHRSWREIVALLLDVGEGLVAAHAAELIHRDFKPENVLVGEDGRARVSDFGIAHLGKRTSERIISLVPDSDVTTPMTVTGAVMGTPAYMAPEQLAGDAIDARADQFAFCVVAWECLLGVRPFPGNSLAALAVAIERQQPVRPTKTAVPQRVLDVIKRGLAADPKGRYPDLPTLLAKLRATTARKASRWVVLGTLAVAVPAAVAVTAFATGGGREDSCAVDDTALAGVWDDELRDKVRAAFVAARPKDGLTLEGRIERILDKYAEAWAASRREACEASRRGNDQPEVAELRMACLDRKRDELAGLTRSFAEADARLAGRSVSAALGLTSVTSCNNLSALVAPDRVPDQIQRIQVELQRAQLAFARGLRLLGKLDPAIEKAENAYRVAKELHYRPLEAEALLLLGDMKDRKGDSETAIKLLEQAAIAANASNHRMVAAEAWSNLAWVVGYGARDFDRGMFAVQQAAAALEGISASPELSAQLTNYEALILETKGKLADAKSKYLAALAAYEKIEPDSWKISIIYNDLGGLERKLGNLDASRDLHTRALAIRTRLFGEAHPFVFSSLNNLGTVAFTKGDMPEAERYFEKAKAVALEVFPPKHPQTALVLSNLGSVYDRQDNLAKSVASYREALAMYEALRGPTHPDVANAHQQLGNALRQQDKLAEAAAAFDRALAILDDKPDNPQLPKLLADYGELLTAKEPKRAEPLLLRARDIVEKEAPDDPELAYSLTALGELYLATKRPALARPALERALAIRTADKATDPEDLARTELALAKLAWATPSERRNAVELAQAAKQRLEAAKVTHRKGYKAVTAWLTAHSSAK